MPTASSKGWRSILAATSISPIAPTSGCARWTSAGRSPRSPTPAKQVSPATADRRLRRGSTGLRGWQRPPEGSVYVATTDDSRVRTVGASSRTDTARPSTHQQLVCRSRQSRREAEEQHCRALVAPGHGRRGHRLRRTHAGPVPGHARRGRWTCRTWTRPGPRRGHGCSRSGDAASRCARPCLAASPTAAGRLLVLVLPITSRSSPLRRSASRTK
jgi:hypothetical protein